MRLPITEQPDFLSRVSGRSEATAEALDWLYANVVPALKCVAKSARCCEQDTKKKPHRICTSGRRSATTEALQRALTIKSEKKNKKREVKKNERVGD